MSLIEKNEPFICSSKESSWQNFNTEDSKTQSLGEKKNVERCRQGDFYFCLDNYADQRHKFKIQKSNQRKSCRCPPVVGIFVQITDYFFFRFWVMYSAGTTKQRRYLEFLLQFQKHKIITLKKTATPLPRIKCSYLTISAFTAFIVSEVA